MKASTCCTHNCRQGRDCPLNPEPAGADAWSIVLWGAILGLLISLFVG